MLLKPQEIRSAIFIGPFSDLLKNLNEHNSWRSVFGPINPNMRDQELILRFLALYFMRDTYRKPMNEFLNKYMGKNRSFGTQSEDALTRVFISTIDVVHRCLGQQAFRPKNALNAAVFDAVMYGVARRLEHGDITDCQGLKARYDELLSNEDFSRATQRSTTDEESVNARLKLASEAFRGVA